MFDSYQAPVLSILERRIVILLSALFLNACQVHSNITPRFALKGYMAFEKNPH